MDQELFSRFVKCTTDVLGVAPDSVVPSAHFVEDLGGDSLGIVELVMALEEEFGVEVPEKEVEDIKTVGQAYDLIVGKLG
ncbi:MAG: acyl carrier protein [Ilumatobacteraceae bacterium]